MLARAWRHQDDGRGHDDNAQSENGREPYDQHGHGDGDTQRAHKQRSEKQFFEHNPQAERGRHKQPFYARARAMVDTAGLSVEEAADRLYALISSELTTDEAALSTAK